MNRRSFLEKLTWAGGCAATLALPGCAAFTGQSRCGKASMMGFRAAPLERIRVGLIGLGNRGSGAVKRLSKVPGMEITALCDLYEDRVAKQQQSLTNSGTPPPQGYFGSPDAWFRLCESPDVDLVYICTPWLWHTPMCVRAMRCGKHVATEIPAAVTVEQCWQLVETSEATRRHCMVLENCCYGQSEMFALTLCRKGRLGELVHGEGAYIHDLRISKLREESEGGRQGRWRLEWSKQHTGNPYPCHGLGPICQYMNVNRGDRLDYLTSVSSAPFGLALAAADKYGKNSAEAKAVFKQGDMNTSVIRTRRGRTILLQHDTTSPRPYSRINMISGTKGILADYPLRVALAPDTHTWLGENELEELKSKYVHPLWDKSGKTAAKVGGHGGMDFLMDLRLSHCLRNGLPLDIDVYDAALWSSIIELSERSALREGESVKIPDFTRGGWETAEPLGLVSV